MKRERLLSLFAKKSAKAEPPPASPNFPYKIEITPEQESQYPELPVQIKAFERCAVKNEELRKQFLAKNKELRRQLLATPSTEADTEPVGDVYRDAVESVRAGNGRLSKHLVHDDGLVHSKVAKKRQG